MKKVVLASIFTMITLLGISCYKFYSIDDAINVTVNTKMKENTFGTNNDILSEEIEQNVYITDNYNIVVMSDEKEEVKTSNTIPEKQNVVTEDVVSEKTTTTQEETKENVVESNVVVEEAKEETADNKLESNDNNSQNNKFNIKDKEKITDKFISSKNVEVVDKSKGKMCAQAIEYFYEDAYYKYYFNCIKSSYMYVIKNGKEYKLVEALKTGIVTMQELEENGYKFPKKSKNVFVK